MKIKPLNVVYALIWLILGGAFAYIIYTGLYQDYHGRKGQAMVAILDSLVSQFGRNIVAGAFFLIGLVIAIWAARDTDD